MYAGFDIERSKASFFRTRRAAGTGVALALYGAMAAWALSVRPKEDTVSVELEPEIHDLEVEETPEEELEVEPEPEPPPPDDVKVVRRSKPVPPPKVETPTEVPQEVAPESAQEKAIEVGPGGGGGGGGGGRGAGTKPKARPEPAPKPKARPAGKKRRKVHKIADRPEDASPPKPSPNNAVPAYPREMRDRGITGRVVLRLKIDAAGKVRGAQILKVVNDAPTDEEQARFNKMMKKAVIAAVRTWTYKPAMLAGKPIETGHMVTIPFKLQA